MSEMACGATDDPELIEAYLLGRMDEPARDSFETHLFECDRCLAHLRLLESVQAELRKTPPARVAEPPAAPARWWTWAAAAAVLAIVAGGAAVLAPSAPPAPSSPAPVVAATPTLSPAILALGKIDPPRYVALELRGAEGASGFDEAMRAYAAGRYTAAADGLRRVRRKEPGNRQVDFFLGVSLLMISDAAADGDAIESLRRVASGGDSYRQLASLYLGSALVRRGDLDGADAEWERTRQLPGAHADDAALLLHRLRSARGR